MSTKKRKSKRKTKTGIVLEKMVLPALELGNYEYTKQKVIGERLNGRKHKVDILVTNKSGHQLLVSLKWQQVSGTAEQKIPYEVMCLHKALNNHGNNYKKAYIVLGGPGWTLREFYVNGGLKDYFKFNVDNICIIKLEDFIFKANSGKL